MRLKIFFMLVFISVKLIGSTNISIRHNPITSFSYPGRNILFSATAVASNCSVAKIQILYRAAGEYDFTTNTMQTNTGSSNYTFTLTNSSLTKKNLEYFFLAEDNFGNYYRQPEESSGYYLIKISSKVEGIITPDSPGSVILADDVPDDSKQTALIVDKDSVFSSAYFGIEYFPYDTIEITVRNDNQTVYNNEFLTDNILPVAMYDFYRADSGLKQKFAFRKKVTLYMRYFDEDNDGIVDATSYDENKLKLFYWDNVKWRYIESSIDTVNNVCIVKTEHLNRFAIFYTDRNITELNKRSKILDYVANSSFSPFDGEVVIFGIKNDISEYKVTIYNFYGKKIRVLTTNSWDGRDENGNIVDSGIYIYKIADGSNSITGMLNIIK